LIFYSLTSEYELTSLSAADKTTHGLLDNATVIPFYPQVEIRSEVGTTAMIICNSTTVCGITVGYQGNLTIYGIDFVSVSFSTRLSPGLLIVDTCRFRDTPIHSLQAQRAKVMNSGFRNSAQGAIWANWLFIQHCHFDRNIGKSNIIATDYLFVDHSTFLSLSAGENENGGAIRFTGSNISITNSNFSNCKTLKGDGGAISIEMQYASSSQDNFVFIDLVNFTSNR
jgi:hypothetical protein